MMVNIMTYHSEENKNHYFPPMLSNGDISFAVDAEGMIGYMLEDYKKKGINAFDGIVVRYARRSAMCNDVRARLFPFGKFTFREGSSLEQWTQELNVENGFFESECLYESGATIRSKGFIHPSHNIYALQKTFENISGTREFAYEVTLCGYNESISRYMQVLYTRKQEDICCIGFKMYGMDVFCGEIHFFVDKDFSVNLTDAGAQISFSASAGETVTFYYYLEDDLEKADFSKVLHQYKQTIHALGFDGLLKECTDHYDSFGNLGYVKTSDEKLNAIYKTSLYSIKCNTTKASIAVGFNNGSWDGRYFAFDEYTSYYGLLSANRLELAKKVPLYRKNVCLDVAIQRASDSHRTTETEDMARFHWQTGEVDRIELAAEGHWLDHIFHIPLVGIGAFEYYEYSKDVDFLRDCYPMIRACSKFITKHMLYKDGDQYYIGKCTDLERLGSSIQNPFMTACGAIKLLQCCKKAADILETDEKYSAECAYISKKLYENLPAENGMYVPHLNCKQKSIAVFAGKFPFDLLNDSDEKMLCAWEDFEINGRAYGNMYPVGNNISPWYACWKALGYARAKMAENAYKALKQVYPSAGVFGELFEINEPVRRNRPWFSTAAGIFISAVNDMLLQTEGNTVHLLPAFPRTADVSFKLAAKGGITVEAEIKNEKLLKCTILRNGIDVTNEFAIQF